MKGRRNLDVGSHTQRSGVCSTARPSPIASTLGRSKPPLYYTPCGSAHETRGTSTNVYTTQPEASVDQLIDSPVAPEAVVHADPLRDALITAVGDEYEIIRLIGRGGMGAVYLARDTALERLVAIKVLPPGGATDAGVLERFRREAKTVANLQHVGIVPLYAFGERRGLCWFVMGYVRGESLAARLDREAPMDVETTRTLIAQVADALDHAHRQGIVHRDIKPDNVLIDDSNGRALLTDFGIARADRLVASTSLTQVGSVMGTPHYMSPEQATAEPTIDGRSDLYSVGVMAYQMLSGRLPFNGQSFRELLMQHVSAKPAPLSEVAPGVPSDLADAVTRCLEKDPEKRFADGRSLRSAVGGTAYDDNTLTYELAELRHFVAWSVVLVVLNAIFATVSALRVTPLFGLPVWIWRTAPLVIIPYGFKVREAMKRGYDWPTVKRVMTLPPPWWWLWWPKAWRRAGDVFDALPQSIKIARYLMYFVTFLGLLEAPLLVWAGDERHGVASTLLPAQHSIYDVRWLGTLDRVTPLVIILGFLVVFAGAFVVSTLICERVGRRFGLSGFDRRRLAFKPTDSSFWRDPRVQPIFRAAATQARPSTPSEFISQILIAAGTLPPAANTAGSSAVTAGRQFFDAIAADERQLALLEKSAPRNQLDRLEAEIVILDSEGVESEEMALLIGQRDAMLRSRERMQVLTARRDQSTASLEAIWAELRRLPLTTDAAATQEIAARLTALCERAQSLAPPRRSTTGAQRAAAVALLLCVCATAAVAWQTRSGTIGAVRALLSRVEPDSAIVMIKTLGGTEAASAEAMTLLGDAYFQIGSARVVLKRPGAARKGRAAYDSVLARDSNNIRALEQLAWFHRVAPRYFGGDRAVAASLVRTLDIRAPYRGQLMRAYFTRLDGRKDAGASALRQLVASAPDSAAGWFALGDFALTDGRADEALSAFQRYHQLLPADDFGLLILGKTAAVHGVHLQEGEQGLRDFLRTLTPKTRASEDVAWWRLGQILEKQGRREDARAAFKKAITLDQRDDDFQASLRALEAAGPP